MKSNQSIRPTTLEGIKRLAKGIKRDLDVTHGRALDLAAQQANFENFRHARQALQHLPLKVPDTE